MISARKQKIVGYALGVPVAGLVVASVVYLVATGSSLAVPMLFFVVGSVAGASLGYLVARSIKPRETLTGRLVLGGILAAVVLLSFSGSAVLPELFGGDYTGPGGFLRGFAYTIGLMALFRLMLPDRFAEEGSRR